MKPLYALIAHTTDGCTYNSYRTLCTFTDKAVAELVAERLGFPAVSNPSANFYVEPIAVYIADSEDAVAAIAAALTKEHKL